MHATAAPDHAAALFFPTARDKLASSRRRASQVLMSTSARWREMQTGEAHRNFVHWEGEGEELLQDAPEEPEHSSGSGTGEPRKRSSSSVEVMTGHHLHCSTFRRVAVLSVLNCTLA